MSLKFILRTAVVAIGGAILLALATIVGVIIELAINLDCSVSVSLVMMGGIVGIAAGWILGPKWYLALLIPVLFFCTIALAIFDARPLWIGGVGPLTTVFLLSLAYVGHSYHRTK